MKLSEIVGLSPAIASLRASVARDAVPSATLLVGPEGVGKSTLAMAFVQTLLCKNPAKSSDGAVIDSCGACVNCKRLADGNHPDVLKIAPDGDVTKIWQLWSRPGHPSGALESLPFAPAAGPRRIFVFERAETFNDESANSLLKALEEPPAYVNFLLCAPSPAAVLPTILSRCQLLRCTSAPITDVIAALVARGCDESDARTIAAYAEGAIGRAIRLFGQPELKEQRDSLLELATSISKSPGIAAFRLAEELRNAAKPPKGKKSDEDDAEKAGRGDLGRALDILCAWYGDLLAFTIRGESAPLIHADRRAQIADAAGRYRPEQIAQNIETLFAFRKHLARNANAQLATEVLMLKLTPKKSAA